MKSAQLLLCIAFMVIVTSAYTQAQNHTGSVQRGEYVFAAGGCTSCHTQAKALAGNVKFDTPFGIFYSSNISPDLEFGIGDWTDEEFIRAMREGISPAGEHYYPAFPYTSYASMSTQDLLDLKAYLDAQPAVASAPKKHQLKFPFNQRSLLGLWKWVSVDDPWREDPAQSEAWNRGGYLVNGPGHCAQCHTPRNLIGGLKNGVGMVGNKEGPEGEIVPSLFNPQGDGIGQWGVDDFEFALSVGMTPDGDFLGGSMSHVLENTTGKLTDEDISAISQYLYSKNNPKN
jgi:mono/diheme cytochrome c family protein